MLFTLRRHKKRKKGNKFNDWRRREHVPVESVQVCQTLATSSLELSGIFQAEINLIRNCQFIGQGIFTMYFFFLSFTIFQLTLVWTIQWGSWQPKSIWLQSRDQQLVLYLSSQFVRAVFLLRHPEWAAMLESSWQSLFDCSQLFCFISLKDVRKT